MPVVMLMNHEPVATHTHQRAERTLSGRTVRQTDKKSDLVHIGNVDATQVETHIL